MFKHFHPFKPFINKETEKIIIGTLPPPRFCTKEYKKEDVLFCYGSADNQLWRVLNKVFDLNLPFDNSQKAVTLRKEFLKKHKIGVCDIVDSCKREKIDASDLGMKDIVLRDILSYLKNYPNINTLVFTGGYCKNSPEYFFRKVLKQQNLKFTKTDDTIPKKHKFSFNNKEYKTISLSSPSNAANRSIGSNILYKEKKKINPNYNTFDFRFDQYKKVFMS